MSSLGSRNVQSIIPADAHRVLREVAYEKQIPLKDLIRVILLKFVEDCRKVAKDA